jgi:hypothetical protein
VNDADEWSAKSAWMRAQGALVASWHPDGTLASVTLGPEPILVGPQPEPKPPAVTLVPRAGSRLVRVPTTEGV